MQAKGWSVSQQNRRRALLSGLIVVVLFILCGVLGALQYRWIGEVSVAARERLRGSLQASLNRFNREFNSELSTAAAAIIPSSPPDDSQAARAALTRNYAEWKKETHHGAIFSSVAMAIPKDDSVSLEMIDQKTGVLHTAEWPESWSALRTQIESRISAGPRRGDAQSANSGLLFEIPVFGGGNASDPVGFGRPGFSGR